METALIVALVSAAVSLIGLLASLRLARQQQEASRTQIALAAVVKADEGSVEALRRSGASSKLRSSSASRSTAANIGVI
jgi:hypothetical protein